MSVVSLIKLIVIGVGLFFYYRKMEEEGGYYISFPIIGAGIVLLGLSLTLDVVGASLFLFEMYAFLYFAFTFMSDIDTTLLISYFVINFGAYIGSRFGLFGGGIFSGVLGITTIPLWVLRYIDMDFVITLVKFFIVSIAFTFGWTYLYARVIATLLYNMPSALI